jgi:YD repeat-containing protein
LAGRLIEEISNDGTITHLYDTKWKGALTKSTLNRNNISEEFDYDGWGRVVKLTETVDDKIFVTQTAYDSCNRVEFINYPSGFGIKQEYNSNGFLAKVIDAATNRVYWQAVLVSARGQLEEFTLGNQLTTFLEYDPEKGYLSNMVTNGIQDWTYRYNTVGNLVERKDNTRNRTETFEYDNLNRLKNVYHNGMFRQGITYDEAGNITSKTGVGTHFLYESGTNKLLSVYGAEYNPPEWDLINYTAYNKISHVIQGNNQLALVYGVKKERKKSVTMKNGISEIKYYAGSLYEEQYLGDGEIKKIYYIFADGGAIAIYEKSNRAVDKVRYMHKDHLGSTQAYSDEAGFKVQELS